MDMAKANKVINVVNMIKYYKEELNELEAKKKQRKVYYFRRIYYRLFN